MSKSVEFQKLIGVDKKNPNFTICKRPSDPGNIYVFFRYGLIGSS